MGRNTWRRSSRAGLLVELLAGEAVGHAEVVGDFVGPGFAEGEILQVLIDLTRPIGGVGRRAQMIRVVIILEYFAQVSDAGAVAFAGGEGFQLGDDARLAGEHMLGVAPQRGDIPRIDVERFTRLAAFHHAVGVGVIFEERDLPSTVFHPLQTVVFVPGHTAVGEVLGGIPAGLVAVQIVNERPVADLRGRMRLARGVSVVPVIGQRHIREFGAVTELSIGVLILPRDIVDAIVTHRQRELFSSDIRLRPCAGR